ncbi:hypothetical protein BKA82DRAFT_4432229 [Pisolithus tinctorius]|nr:hypothetical protein BKA82DRAFT_4432229 [Pisolithus tinctorius]
MTQDAMMDAWRGMVAFANTKEFKDVGVTQQQNKEWGSRRIKRWWGWNWNAAQWSTYKHVDRKYFCHWGPSSSCYTGIQPPSWYKQATILQLFAFPLRWNSTPFTITNLHSPPSLSMDMAVNERKLLST